MAVTDQQLEEIIAAAKRLGIKDEKAGVEAPFSVAAVLAEGQWIDAEYGDEITTADLADERDFLDITGAYVAGRNEAKAKYAADIHTVTYNPYDDVVDGEIVGREDKTVSEHVEIEIDEDGAVSAMVTILADKGAIYDNSGGSWFENDVEQAVVSYVTGTHESITVHFTKDGAALSVEEFEAVHKLANE